MIEDYNTRCLVYKDDMKFNKIKGELMAKFRTKRNAERVEASRIREQQLQEERNKRNQERMIAKQKVVANVHKRIMFRSPQPGIQRQEKQVKIDQVKLDMLKYLGTTLEEASDRASARLGSSFSRRSI